MASTIPTTTSLEWLECFRCHAAYSGSEIHNTCRCGGVLLARYRLDEAARTLTRDALRDRPPTLWRYAEVLPGSQAPLTLGEGLTLLHPARYLSAQLGLEDLRIKDESSNPTGSFKARGMAVALTMARSLGIKRVALPSAGNAGGAAAAYGALAGLGVDVFLPIDTPGPFRLEAEAFGARVHSVEGDISACGRKMRREMPKGGWFDLSTLKEPYRLEGKKTLAYELAEQLDWTLPDVIVYPTGGGTGLVGMWKAFEEIEQLGLVQGQKRPRMVVVQAAQCAPIVRAFEAGTPRAQPWKDPRTYASGLRVPAPYADELILQAIRESGGTAVAVQESEIASGQRDMARGEGIHACPEGGATLAALRKLVRSGFVKAQDRVVLFNTGTGLKYPEIPASVGQ